MYLIHARVFFDLYIHFYFIHFVNAFSYLKVYSLNIMWFVVLLHNRTVLLIKVVNFVGKMTHCLYT